ncbi:MAG: hypothetical protein MUC69_02115 [Gemmatimonadales bacterium]|jgi:hypothetical protein|nr:hypothetical protein [Gemmatimonadales bacterium]
MASTRAPAAPTSPDSSPYGRELGDLARADVRWRVHLEARPHPRGPDGARGTPLQGRLHFVEVAGAERVRSTGWIFVEWTEADILARFGEFSAAELWLLLDSLG